MRRLSATCIVAALLCACLATASAQDVAKRAAPWLGDAKYTIDVAGSLAEVIEELNNVVHRRVYMPSVRRPPTGEGKDYRELPVKLDMADATLGEIALSICEQTGLVYYIRGHMGPVQFQPGDVNVDRRPTVELEEYVIRVTRVKVESEWQYDFPWGAELPDEPRIRDKMEMVLELFAKSREAAARLAGIDLKFTMHLNNGAKMEFPKDPPTRPSLLSASMMQTYGPVADERLGYNLSLPSPFEGATAISRFEGTLRLYSDVMDVELDIPADSEGKEFEQGELSVRVEKWESKGENHTVTLLTTLPPGGTRAQVRGESNAGQWAVLVDKEGKEHRSRTVIPTVRAGTVRSRVAFRSVPSVDHLRVRVLRRDKWDKTVPFAIENIPIP